MNKLISDVIHTKVKWKDSWMKIKEKYFYWNKYFNTNLIKNIQIYKLLLF